MPITGENDLDMGALALLQIELQTAWCDLDRARLSYNSAEHHVELVSRSIRAEVIRRHLHRGENHDRLQH